MKKVVITIRTGNAAFEDYGWAYEVKRILDKVSFQLCEGFSRKTNKLYDINGNEVGNIKLY